MSTNHKTPMKAALEARGEGAQIELARAINVSEGTVSRWARGKATPIPNYRRQIAEHLAMPVEALWPEP